MDVNHYETSSKKLKAWRRRICIKCCFGRRFYLLIFDRDDGSNFHKILLDGFQSYTLHVDDESTIYLSEMSEDGRCLHVYSYKLSDRVSEIPKVLNKTNVTSAPPLSSSKHFPATIWYGRHLVIFSTLITYWGMANRKNPEIDFELYDPKGKNHVTLPQLWIRRCGTHYELVDLIHSCATTFIGNGCRSPYPDTNGLWRHMCLLDDPSERFHLVHMIYERVRHGYRVTRRVPFGVTAPYVRSDVMTFCDDGVACIVQVGTDVEEDNAYLAVHLLELDFSKFPWTMEENEDELMDGKMMN
ncbi:hypothetical protein OROGR_016046 [Orobanche gracilis]